jgi:uncharacterized protein YggE
MQIMPRLALYSVLVLAVQPIAAPAQSQRAGSDRKTIEITATEKVLVAADIATIKIGYQNLSAAKDAAYAENTRTANKIIKAILDAGVPKEAIETESLKLEQDQERYGAKSDQPAKYLTLQEWQIHSAAPDAQKIVDIAIAAGANQIESVEWSMKDPDELDAKAYAAALNRAKSLGEQTATNTGLKLGEIISCKIVRPGIFAQRPRGNVQNGCPSPTTSPAQTPAGQGGARSLCNNHLLSCALTDWTPGRRWNNSGPRHRPQSDLSPGKS